MPNLLATMITTTSYGTWLAGDLRGYVESGKILPGNPERLKLSKHRMLSAPVYFNEQEQLQLFHALTSASNEFDYQLHAASIESWHVHWVITHIQDTVQVMTGRLKNRMRQALNRGRIWTAGYDKRYCFNQAQVDSRIEYIRRHEGYRPLPIVYNH